MKKRANALPRRPERLLLPTRPLRPAPSRRLLLLLACVAAASIPLACGRTGLDGDTPEAPAAALDAAAPDGASDVSIPDAADSADTGCPPVSGCTGPLLLTDDVTDRIYVLDTNGKIEAQFVSPVAGVTGIVHDRRTGDGFWITHDASTQPMFYKLDWSGQTTQTVDYSYQELGTTGIRGLDIALGADPADDAFMLVETNGVPCDETSGVTMGDGGFVFGWSYTYDDAGVSVLDRTGFWGIALTGTYTTNLSKLVRWTTHDGKLENWLFAEGFPKSSYSLGTSDARGVAITPAGDFYVVDGASARVLHVGADGSALGSFAAPGPSPMGISYRR